MKKKREGEELQDMAYMHGLEQFMKEPTHDRHLRDSVLADCDFIAAFVHGSHPLYQADDKICKCVKKLWNAVASMTRK